MTSSFQSLRQPEPRPTGRPTILLGTRPSWLGTSPGTGLEHAGQHVYGVDLDLRSVWIAPSWSRFAADASRRMTRVRSAWIAGSITGIATHSRILRLTRLLRGCKDELGLRTIIVPRAAHLHRGSSVGPFVRDIVADRSRISARIAIGIRAVDFADDRRHLDQLAATRRLAEEWDLDVALDLTGSVSPYWEAEAAIVRLMPRLTVVRVHPWLSPGATGSSLGPPVVAQRTIAMLADQGYAGSISLVERPVPWWTMSLPDGRGAEALTRGVILDRYDRQRPAPGLQTPQSRQTRPQDRL